MREINNVYAVFFDTNTIKGKHWLDWSVRQHVPSIGKNMMITTKLYLPEVVQKEWSRYYTRYAKEQQGKIVDAGKALLDMDFDALSFMQLDDSKIVENSKQFLSKLGFSIVPTPHEKIDYKHLLDLAIQHEAPFEPADGSDKGLKDAVIAHTIQQFAEDHPQEVIVFIGRDNLMSAYLRDILPKKTTFKFYKSIDEFQEELKLRNNDLSEELARGASKAFFVPGVKETFYYRLNVGELLIGNYRSRLTDADAAKSHLSHVEITKDSPTKTAVSHGDWSIGAHKIVVEDPSFTRRDNQRLHWTVTVGFTQTYNVSVPMRETITPYVYKIDHNVVYTLAWSAELSSTGELINPSIEKLAQANESQSIVDIQKSVSAFNQLVGFDIGTRFSSLATVGTGINLTPTANSLATTLTNIAQTMPDMSWVNNLPKASMLTNPPIPSGLQSFISPPPTSITLDADTSPTIPE